MKSLKLANVVSAILLVVIVMLVSGCVKYVPSDAVPCAALPPITDKIDDAPWELNYVCERARYCLGEVYKECND